MDFLRFTLEKYKTIASRYNCPACNKPRVFARYVDLETGEHLADLVGRCNREIECGYHYKPIDFFKANGNVNSNLPLNKTVSEPLKRNRLTVNPSVKETLINPELFEKSLENAHFEQNHFIQYLKKVTGPKWEKLTKRFYVGNARKWLGSVVFWQVDYQGKIRTGKIMDYNPLTGKRIKERITWVHSELKLVDFNLKQCLFGEHQLMKEPVRNVGIVESEKTAVLATAYLPELTWMASGSLNGISIERLSPVKNHNIILYPDIKGFDKWNEKAIELRKVGFRVTVSDLLEKADFVTHEERNAGFDLADYLPRLSLPLTTLEKMEATNPLINDLINRLDLIEI